MSTMIKLQLDPPADNFASVQNLPGLAGIELDKRYGLVPIAPQKGLYVVSANHLDDLERRRKISPEILGVYGPVRISTT